MHWPGDEESFEHLRIEPFGWQKRQAELSDSRRLGQIPGLEAEGAEIIDGFPFDMGPVGGEDAGGARGGVGDPASPEPVLDRFVSAVGCIARGV